MSLPNSIVKPTDNASNRAPSSPCRAKFWSIVEDPCAAAAKCGRNDPTPDSALLISARNYRVPPKKAQEYLQSQSVRTGCQMPDTGLARGHGGKCVQSSIRRHRHRIRARTLVTGMHSPAMVQLNASCAGTVVQVIPQKL
jgi:hypothetical protein